MTNIIENPPNTPEAKTETSNKQELVVPSDLTLQRLLKSLSAIKAYFSVIDVQVRLYDADGYKTTTHLNELLKRGFIEPAHGFMNHYDITPAGREFRDKVLVQQS